MDMPKLYRPVKIKFWSLRNGLGENYGVIFDIDEEVERIARRVLCDEGWKWQIKDTKKLSKWDYFIETDQISLDECGMDLSFIKFCDDK
jgi:hypothetical protein